MSKEFEKLSLVVNGETVIFPCVEIMALSTTPKADGASGYVRFYQAFARRYGDQLRHYQLNDSVKWKPIQPKDRDKLPGWFSDARALKKPLLGITMHSNEVAGDPRPPLFRMMFQHVYPQYPRGMFRIALPLDVVGDDAESLVELIDDVMAEFPVHWGTAGYSFCWDTGDTTIEGYANQWLGRHLAKHPGLSTGDLLQSGVAVELGLANIGWLTFVGDALVEQLGGREAVAAALAGTGVELREYEKGVALQAGPVPELGDVNRKNKLARYREVGRVLAPVFVPEDDRDKLSVTGFADPDKKLEWLERFLP